MAPSSSTIRMAPGVRGGSHIVQYSVHVTIPGRVMPCAGSCRSRAPQFEQYVRVCCGEAQNVQHPRRSASPPLGRWQMMQCPGIRGAML